MPADIADKKRTAGRTAYAALLAAYTLFMLYLLFFRNRRVSFDRPLIFGVDIKLIPFRTTSEFIDILISPPDAQAFRHGVRNLAGNIVLFVPYGFSLPYLFGRCRKYVYTALYSGLGITAVELAQLLTRRGICDIDDLIFNLAGVSLGFAFFVLYRRVRRVR